MSWEPNTLLMKIPEISDLIFVTVKILKTGVRDRSAITDFHWQILKARQLIFETPKILVGTADYDKSLLYIICFKQPFENGALKESLEPHNLEILKIEKPVPNHVFKSCFEYTLRARLSPEWNKVAWCYVKDKNFLLKRKPLDAVETDIISNDNDSFYFTVEAFHVQIPRPNVTDFGVKISEYEKFKANEIDTIKLRNIPVYKLPNMLRGTAVSLHNKITPACPLRTYSDIRRHWKNMYGYRLPAREQGIVYGTVQIRLRQQIDEKFYPIICTRLNYLNKIRTFNAQNIAESFIESFQAISRKYFHQITFHSLVNDPLTEIKFLTATQATTAANNTQHISLCTPTRNEDED